MLDDVQVLRDFLIEHDFQPGRDITETLLAAALIPAAMPLAIPVWYRNYPKSRGSVRDAHHRALLVAHELGMAAWPVMTSFRGLGTSPEDPWYVIARGFTLLSNVRAPKSLALRSSIKVSDTYAESKVPAGWEFRSLLHQWAPETRASNPNLSFSNRPMYYLTRTW